MILAAALLAARLSGIAPSRIVSVAMAGLALFVALLVRRQPGLADRRAALRRRLDRHAAPGVGHDSRPDRDDARGARPCGGPDELSVTAASILSMAFAGAVGAVAGVRTVFLLCAAVIALGAVAAVLLFRRAHDQPDVYPGEAPATPLTPAAG